MADTLTGFIENPECPAFNVVREHIGDIGLSID
jgi:hypothetical protein